MGGQLLFPVWSLVASVDRRSREASTGVIWERDIRAVYEIQFICRGPVILCNSSGRQILLVKRTVSN